MEHVTISTNSWHYKLVECFFPMWTCHDICSYRQRLVVAIIVSIFLVSFSLSFLVGAVMLPYFVYQNYANGLDFGVLSEYVRFMLVAGLIVWVLAITITLMIAISKIVGVVCRHRLQTKSKKEKSVISEMYTSWKQKICRPVKFN